MTNRCRTVLTPAGTICLSSDGSQLVSALFSKRDEFNDRDRILDQAQEELKAYFQKTLNIFKTPVAFKGTSFQKKIWEETRKVAYGHTLSYKELCIQASTPKAFRACGQALNVNPLLIFVPCHRICASNGGLGGYAKGVKIKQQLLQLERNT